MTCWFPKYQQPSILNSSKIYRQGDVSYLPPPNGDWMVYLTTPNGDSAVDLTPPNGDSTV
jgi:hypothetical protein